MSSENHIACLKEIIKDYNVDDEKDMKRLITKVNSYLKNNPAVNEIDTHDMNISVEIKGLCFCKRNGKMRLGKKYYKPVKPSKESEMHSKDVPDLEIISDENVPERDIPQRSGMTQEDKDRINKAFDDMNARIEELYRMIDSLRKGNSGNAYSMLRSFTH